MIYAGYIYIVLPFLIFIIGWLKWYYALIISATVLISLFFSFNQYEPYPKLDIKKYPKKIIIAFSVIILWVLFSGIGGFGYQNGDHHFRNAIFRDLITHEWPVIYDIQGIELNHPLKGKTFMLVYYIGYWLPSAVVGKLFGWSAANFSLFLWTVLGLFLTYYFICCFLNLINS
jgi:hypothetical protein